MHAEAHFSSNALLTEVNLALETSLARVRPPLQEVCAYLFCGGGRIRPRLFLAALQGQASLPRACVLKAACALELLHTATLLQDDIFDGALIRRGRTATHLAYGTALATLASDWLLLEAMRLAADVHAGFALLLARAAQDTVAAEALELSPPEMTALEQARSHVHKVAYGKTGSLFAAALAGAALLSTAGPAEVEQHWKLGCELGVTFQIMDDCKDLFLSAESASKDTGQDLAAGRITIPFLFACEHAGQAECAKLLHAMMHGGLSCRQQDTLLEAMRGPLKQKLLGDLEARCANDRNAMIAVRLPKDAIRLVEHFMNTAASLSAPDRQPETASVPSRLTYI